MYSVQTGHVTAGSINLQATLSATSACNDPPPFPHHPITCTSKLHYHEDATLECEHARTAIGDTRTQACVNGTIAILLFEILHDLVGQKAEPEAI